LSETQLQCIADDGTQVVAGVQFRIRPGVLHGAVVGPKGGAFLSLQHWIEGEPTSVGLDWLGPEHVEIRHG
jgi:hypothetical protein